MCGSRKYPHSPIEGIGNSREEGGSQRPKNIKGMYEAKLEFPEGWGWRGHRANPFPGVYGYFLEPNNISY